MSITWQIIFFLWLCMFTNSAVADEHPVLLDTCPQNTTCLHMSINIGNINRDQLVESEVTKGSYSDFILTVWGKLNDMPERMHRLRYRSFTDGITCNDFGQGIVAVRGFSSISNPLLLTSSGIIEITNNSIRVGCSDCAKLYKKTDNKLVQSTLTPGFYMTRLGYGDAKVTYSENGEIYLWNQNRCITLTENSLFKLVDPKRCIEPEIVGHYNQSAFGIEPAPAEWILDIKGSRYFVFVNEGACT